MRLTSALRCVALLLVFALAARVLLMPIHLSQDQEESRPASQSAPHHDHSTHHHHDSDSCSVCQDLLLTKHVGGGPSLAAPVADWIPVAVIEIPRGVKPARFSLATGGARGPPSA